MTNSASSILCLAGLHFLWQGAAIAAVAWLVAAVARRWSAQAQYLALVIGLTAMPVAFVGTVAWLASSLPAPPLVSFEQPLEVMSTSGEARPLFLLGDSAARLSPVAKSTPIWQQLAPWCAAAYWLAVAALSLRLVLGLSGARKLARESAGVSDERLLTFVADQCELLGIRSVPLVAYCRDVAVPTVIGVLRPTILLPLAATTGLTSKEIETILTHELVHIRRHDQLLVLWQRVVEILFFFHPAVWLLSRRISDVREHCCDDRVIALGIEPDVYVESLLRAAELSLFGPNVKTTSAFAVALSAVDQPSKLRERILRLVDRPAPAPLKLRPSALAIALSLVLLTLAAPFALQALAQNTKAKRSEANPAETSQAISEELKSRDRTELIDSLILRKLEAADSTQNAEASAHEFLRRIFLELTGRPPTADELRAWTKRFAAQIAEEVPADRTEPNASWRAFFGEGQVLRVVQPEPRASEFRAQLGSQFEIVVTGKTDGSVWGTDVYTDDSDVGTAAVHAGLVKPGEQANVTLTIVKSPAQHIGSRRNGVSTADYGRFGGSFMLHKMPESVRTEGSDFDGSGSARPPRRPRTTAGEMSQALGVWERLVQEKRAQADADAAARSARNQAEIAEHNLTEARQRLKLYIEEGVAEEKTADVDLVEIHRTQKADCTKCHQPFANRDLNATMFRGKLGRQFNIEIVGSTEGSIWGTDVYTDDSHIPTAAVHAGIVKAGERAIVTVTMVESPEEHIASERHGVKARAWGSYPASYILMRKSAATFTKPRPPAPATASGWSGKLGRRFDVEIIGATEGSVWGTDVYTDDSHIATAAVHAGLVKPGERAIVTLTIVESPDHHSGSKRNGITTMNFGNHASSFILQRKAEDLPPKERSNADLTTPNNSASSDRPSDFAPAAESAVNKGLRYLQRTQQSE